MTRKLFFSALLSLAIFPVAAQVCTPSPLATTPGLYPNPATDSLPDAYVGVPYTAVITVYAPADTTVTTPAIPPIWPGGPATVQIIKQTLTSIDSLPAVFTRACNPSGCVWTGGTKGCIIISGTPTINELGDNDITVNIQTLLAAPIPGVNLPPLNAPIPYTIRVKQASGIEDMLDANAFRFAPCKPSPASESTVLSFSSPIATELTINVFDLTGATVKTEKFRCTEGISERVLNIDGLSTGLYFVTLNNGINTLKQKLVVK